MLEKTIVELDKIFKTLYQTLNTDRDNPSTNIEDSKFTLSEQQHIINLMRVNHCGEVCAQALYQGQALTAKDRTNVAAFNQAAAEETEHLAWTAKRIQELGGETSRLKLFFYLTSLGVGVMAGLLGDKWNLGFLQATEEQVANHLQHHLQQLPLHDNKSRAILQQMYIDETKHASMAKDYGAVKLPQPIQIIMQIASKIMIFSTYRI